MKPSKVFVNFCFICYMFIGNVNGQQGILVSPTPSITSNRPLPFETTATSKPTMLTTAFPEKSVPPTPIITIKPSIYTDEPPLASINTTTTGVITKTEISSVTGKPPPSLNVQATTVQNESFNNYTKNIEPRNASDDKTVPAPAINNNLTIATEVSTTTPDGKTITPTQLTPKDYAHGNSDYIATTTAFRASRLADVETLPAGVPSTVLSIALQRSIIYPDEVPFGAEATTMSRVTIAEASTIAKTATTVIGQSSPSLTAEITTLTNETIGNYEKDVDLRSVLDNKTMQLSTTTAVPTIAIETNPSPYLVPEDDAYENSYYTGLPPMETISPNKPTTLFSAAVIAAAETCREEAIPSVALSAIDVKPSTYPDENYFRRELTANSEITTAVHAAEATIAKNESINNSGMNVQSRSESIEDKMAEVSAAAAEPTVAEATTVISDEKITTLSQLMPKDVASESGHGHYNMST